MEDRYTAKRAAVEFLNVFVHIGVHGFEKGADERHLP